MNMKSAGVMPAEAADAPPDRRNWLTLLVLSLGLAIVIIDTTIVNVAIPSIRKEFGASLRDVEWINAIYALVYAALIVTWGRLGDQFGRKRIFVAGVVVFVMGSIMVGAAQSIALILVGRFVQGFGAAMTSPATLSIISSTFTGKSRGVAFGIWGAVAGAAAALGPLLGGFLITAASWRWAFLINVPIGIVAIVGSFLYIRESVDKLRNTRIDLLGIVLASLGLSALVFGLIEGQGYGWWTPKETFSVGSFTWPLKDLSITPIAFVIGILFMAAFVVYEISMQRRGGDPLFDFTLLRFKGFRYGLLTVLVIALGEFGVIFVLSLYLQGVRELSAFDTGLLFLPFAITTLIVAPLAGLLSARFGPKWVVTTGMAFEAISIFTLSRIITIDVPLLSLIPVLMLYGAGVGLAIAQLTNVVLSDIPRERAGAGSGANNTVRQLGAAIGIAILGAILAGQIADTGRAELAANTAVPAAMKARIALAFDSGGPSQSGPVQIEGVPANVASSPQFKDAQLAIKQIFNDATTQGTRSAATAAAAFVLLGALSSLLIPNPPRRTRNATQAQPGAASAPEYASH